MKSAIDVEFLSFYLQRKQAGHVARDIVSDLLLKGRQSENTRSVVPFYQ